MLPYPTTYQRNAEKPPLKITSHSPISCKHKLAQEPLSQEKQKPRPDPGASLASLKAYILDSSVSKEYN